MTISYIDKRRKTCCQVLSSVCKDTTFFRTHQVFRYKSTATFNKPSKTMTCCPCCETDFSTKRIQSSVSAMKNGV